MNLDLFSTEDTSAPSLPFPLPSGQGYSYQWNEDLNGFIIAIPNGELFYSEHFFNEKISDRSIDYFLESNAYDWRTTDWRLIDQEQLSDADFVNIKWRHDKLNMYGKEHYLPRYSAWYGNNDKNYTYSGLTLSPNAWNKGLAHIKNSIERVSKGSFNSVLMNWYRDGEDHISWHTDAEKELGENPEVGSVNFGSTRRFLIRRIDNHAAKLEIPLNHGSLLIMRGELQHYWQHSVPKQKKVSGSRINLTFRFIN